MMKKMRVVLYVLAIMLAMTACGSVSEEQSSAEAYIQIAQDFIECGDIDSALKVLENGFKETGDADIAVLMVELSTNMESQRTETNPSEIDNVTVSDESFVDKYIGTWAEESISMENGGLILSIVSIGEQKFSLEFNITQGAPMSRIAEVATEVSARDIVNNCVEIEFEDDGWENSGKIAVTFDDEFIFCEVFDTHYNGEGSFSDWGLGDGVYSLIRNENAYEKLNAVQSENESVTQSRITSSVILRDLGLTEAEFRYTCQPVSINENDQEMLTTNDLLEYPANYIGQCFYFTYKGALDKESNTYRPVKISVDFKGVSADGYTTYRSHPDYSFYKYIHIFDVRDDVYSPTISEGDSICPYMIFDGVQTIGGTDYVCFTLVSVDK